MARLIAPGVIGFLYKDIDGILIPTEGYNNKIKKYQEYADSKNTTIKDFYESLGCDPATWEEQNKSLMFSYMINEKKLKEILIGPKPPHVADRSWDVYYCLINE